MTLSIGTTIHYAFVALWRRRWAAGAILLGWLVLDAALRSGQMYFNVHALLAYTDWMSKVAPNFATPDYVLVLDLATQALNAVIASAFAVLLVRLLILGTPFGAEIGPAKLARAMVSVLIFHLSMTLVYRLATATAFDIVGRVPWRVSPLILLAMWLAAVWFGSRLCLVYANAALGKGWRIGMAWRTTAGHSLRLSLLIGVVLVCEVAIGVVVSSSFPTERVQVAHMPYAFILFPLQASLIVVAAKALLLALAAVVYARLTGFPAPGIPGASRSPEQTAEVFE
ncbi:MAG: hypothetical protein HKM95_04075 [Inquilinus sp.]|nr:hypothetical protein [Inquilinus sp.]